MDLIERTSALEIVRQTSGDYAAAFSEIARLPAADAAPVRHGRWERHTDVLGKKIDDYWYCSECSGCNEFRRSCYCPNCGAKMDGGTE
jgi:hypothetical protein